MARIDKYDPVDGGYRAPLAADRAATTGEGNGNPLAVGHDVNGRVIVGAGRTGLRALLVTTRNMKAAEIVDCMTDGEIVEFDGLPGTTYYARSDTGALEAGDATGAAPAIPTGATHTYTRVGHTVEASRLIVRVAR